MKYIIIDGSKMTSRLESHKYIKELLSFPDYYGNNLDALADCLSEIIEDINITLINYDTFISYQSNCHKGFLKVFNDISEQYDNITFEIK